MYDRELAMACPLPVIGREHEQQPRLSFCCSRRNPANARMRVRAANEGTPSHSGQDEVVHELALAAHKANVLASA
jgi:hypothetical protein